MKITQSLTELLSQPTTITTKQSQSRWNSTNPNSNPKSQNASNRPNFEYMCL